MVHAVTRAILCVATGKGATHDLTLFRDSGIAIHPETELLADAAYQGLWREHACSRTPREATKKCPLTAEQKRENWALSRMRIPANAPPDSGLGSVWQEFPDFREYRAGQERY